MSRVSGLLNQLSSMVRVANSTVYLDVGSQTTRVGLAKKVVYNQPTCATFHQDTQAIVQLGQTAVVSSDRTPGALMTIFSVRQGYLTDMTKARAYISAVINQALQAAGQSVVVSLSARYAVPAGLSPLEKQMLERVLKQAGITRVELVPKPVAIVANMAQPVAPYLCVIDIGGHTTEIGLFVGGEPLAMTTIYTGGDAFTQKIKELVRFECQAQVGWPSAEKLKHQQKSLSFTAKTKEDQTVAVRAKSILNLNPTTVFLKKASLQAAFENLAVDLTEEIKAFLAQLEPEVVTPALEHGIYVTGGGSQMQGLVEHIERELKTEATRSSKPMEDVIRGLYA